MGLDMYAYATDCHPPSPVDFESTAPVEIHYWRKHPNLHGWMEALYRDKGGQAESFNCVNLQLTAQDIDRLESAIRNGNLPTTQGFFFGQSDGTEHNDDLAFVARARASIEAGNAVYYSSWW